MTSPTDFLDTWAKAEVSGDAAALDELLADDFTAVGPLGFTLSKQDWIGRHGPGKLTYDAFTVGETTTKIFGDAAVVVGIQHQDGKFSTGPLPSQLRTTFVLVGQSSGWRIATMHMSFVAGTPGSPPLPGRPA